MTLDVLRILGGLVLLGVAGEFLVRGAVGLAKRFHVTPAVIGLTVVSAGTSMPELVVSVIAALSGRPDMAAANVVGSNIFNLGLVLGLTALVLVIPITRMTLRWEWPVLVAVSVYGAVVLMNLVIGRLEGLVMVLLLAAFNVGMIKLAKREMKARPVDLDDDVSWGLTGSTTATVLGSLLLVLGGEWMVTGAGNLAGAFGISERIIGLTIVAMGTSLPELAASVVAAVRGRSDVAVGNVIGSCVFNLLGILGVSAIIRPLSVTQELASTDLVWMLGFSILLGPLLFVGRALTRVDGLVLTAAFAAYMTLLGISAN